jgi:hypothetical protein
MVDLVIEHILNQQFDPNMPGDEAWRDRHESSEDDIA